MNSNKIFSHLAILEIMDTINDLNSAANIKRFPLAQKNLACINAMELSTSKMLKLRVHLKKKKQKSI
jgi:hypothetical protein